VADLERVYLISGSDRPKVALAVSRLRGHFDDASVERLSAQEATGADVVAACNALGLFGGGRRLVIVEGIDGRRNDEGKLVGAWKAAEVEAVVSYLADPAPDTVLALVAEELKATSALAKACAKVGDVLIYDVSKRALVGWVQKQFAGLKVSVDAEACRALVEVVGDDVDELAMEIDKLATWAGEEPVTERDVLALAAGRAETSIFALTDAWGRRDVGAALAAAEGLLERTGSRRDELPRVVGLLASHVARVRACQAWAAEGLSPREGATKMKRSPYYVEKLFGQAANFGVEELRDAAVRLAELDLALKGGSRLAGDLELALALVDLARGKQPVVTGEAA
jgi:DNA polymerase III delta subunit